MKQDTFFRNFGRGLLYALTVTLGLQIALIELSFGNKKNFGIIGLLLIGIFVIELLSSWIYRAKIVEQKKIYFPRRAKDLEDLLHHTILPIGTYITTVGFLYYNFQSNSQLFFSGVMAIILTVLFTNIRSYYEHRELLEKQTHYIYDVIKVVLFFNVVNFIFHFWPLPGEWLLILIFSTLIASSLQFLTIIRYQKMEFKLALIILFSSVVIGIVGLLSKTFLGINILQTTALMTLCFYVSLALIHHLTHHTLNRTLIMEYTTVVLIAVLLLYGLS